MAGDFFLQPFIKVAAIEEAGELVDAGFLLGLAIKLRVFDGRCDI